MFSGWCRCRSDCPFCPFRPFLGGWRRQVFLLDPAGLDARLHDQRLGVVPRQVEAVEDAGIAGGLAVLALAPAEQVVGSAAREILHRLDIVLAELDEHGSSDAG